MWIALQIFGGWIYGHAAEYLIHKYVLHNHRWFKGPFKRHFGTHHRISRQNDMYDESYLGLSKSSSAFEILGLSLLLLSHLPLLFIIPYFWMTLLYSACVYYYVHRRSHIDVEWGKKWLPWHYAHHMEKDQHQNWGVRLPIFDKVFSKI
jgi:hypothetical protein